MHYLLLVLVLAACGGEEKSPAPAAQAPTPAPAVEPTPSVVKPTLLSLAINTAAELPACNADNNRQLVYVVETKEFQTCQSGAWVKIEIGMPAPVGLSDAQVRDGLIAVGVGSKLIDIPETLRSKLELIASSASSKPHACHKDARQPQEWATYRFGPESGGLYFETINGTITNKSYGADEKHVDVTMDCANLP